MGAALDWLGRIPREVPPAALAVWAVVALVVLGAVILILRAERRHYAGIGKQKGWLVLRLVTLPIAAAAISAVFLATPRSGMESLAWFYLLLFTLAPLLYFGLHALVARLAGLRAGQGLGLAAVGLGILLLPFFAAIPAQSAGHAAQRWWAARESGRAPEAAPAHALAAAQRFALPGGGEIWSQHWRAQPGLRSVESIELPPYGVNGLHGGQRFNAFGTWICRDREDLHVTWPAAMGEAVLTVRWRDAAGTLRRSPLRVAPPPGEPEPLAARWMGEDVSLPVRPPRSAALTARQRPDGKLVYYGSLNQWEPHESPHDNCLPRPYRSTRPLAGIALRIERPNAEPLRAEFPRPPAPSDDKGG